MITKIKITCPTCNKVVEIEKRFFDTRKKHGAQHAYCSHKCAYIGRIKEFPILVCPQCQLTFQSSSSRKKFCCQSCAATYNNMHKTKGTRVSKLEIWLQKKLTELYDFEIKFNSKSEINSELDIYVPHLKLAFELNGPFHYEPIFGKDKLEKIQNNDERKFQACLESSIELCIIDVSKHTYFKEHTCLPFLEIITSILNKKISTLLDSSVQDTPRDGTS